MRHFESTHYGPDLEDHRPEDDTDTEARLDEARAIMAARERQKHHERLVAEARRSR